VDEELHLPNPSSQVHKATYDPDTGRLTLHLNGAVFAYHNVPQKHADGLANAASHGDYFHKHIRHLPHSRVR
jgi:hypothetical protein